MKPCYLFDIDGTLSNSDHRVHHILKEPKGWTAFFALCHLDEPIPHIIQLAQNLGGKTEILFVSGRSDECRDQTLAWLHRHFPGWRIENSDLFMRRAGDHRDDTVVKIELLAAVRAAGWEPLMAFEDRQRVVDAFRAAGLPVAQIAPGNF